MDQLAIQTIENFLDVPLIAPEHLHELDAKEIAAALGRLDNDLQAAEDVSDAWAKPLDEINEERLQKITKLVREAIDNCETCRACDDNPGCARCTAFSQWLRSA